MFSYFYFLFLSLAIRDLSASPDSCAYEFKRDSPSHSPLVFHVADDTPELLLPKIINDSKEKGLLLETNEAVLLSCAGDNNNFQDDSVSTVAGAPSQTVSCVGDNIITNGKSSYNFTGVGCRNRVMADVLSLGASCADEKASLFEIGFNVTNPSTLFWFPNIDTCFDPVESISYYSTHQISGKGLFATEEDSSRPPFEVGSNELYPEFDPAAMYKQAQQAITFENLLGSKELAENLLKSSFFSRGHLAPDADFFYTITSFSTYFFINVGPQWQDINGGAWNQLEIAVRALAVSTLKDYFIHTGTHDILTLKDVNNNDQEMYLYYNKNEGVKKLRIPKFYWKIVEEPISKTGIAFVAINGPVTVSESEWPCKNVCEENHWYSSAWVNKLVCCEVSDLRKAIKETPDVQVNGVLQGLKKRKHPKN